MPALRPVLARSLVALGVLGAAFVAYTQAVAAGVTRPLDLAIANAVAPAWRPVLGVVAQCLSLLGGVEVTALVAAAMAVTFWRGGDRRGAAALLAIPLLWVAELVYKWSIHHPPPLAFAHPDGPSLVTMLHGGTLTLNGSYPSGHMMRSVLVYGLGAFVVRRAGAPSRMRMLAVPVAVVLVLLMALDRIYLGVHWQSDVIGGVLLGGVALAAAVAWLDRPRAPA